MAHLSEMLSQPSDAVPSAVHELLPQAPNRDKVRVQTAAEMERFIKEAEPKTGTALDWWRRHKNSYPLLARVARKYLTPLATSAIIERTFSKAKKWCKDQRSNISSKKMDMMVTLDTYLAQQSAADMRKLLKVGPYRKYGKQSQQVDENDVVVDPVMEEADEDDGDADFHDEMVDDDLVLPDDANGLASVDGTSAGESGIVPGGGDGSNPGV